MSSNSYTNRLINEKSPYLLQHAHNSVDWYPWGDEALLRAQKENKLLLVSIGYSSCHWCHVMAHESFEDPSVAKIMNELFIPVKVDREERPDIDYIYMDAVQMMTGSGGWPLNCFALPDGSPIYGGTYFRKENWVQLLMGIGELYLTNPNEIIYRAANLKVGLIQNSIFKTDSENYTEFIDSEKVYYNIAKRFDTKYGGLNPAPKFLMPVVYNFLTDYFYYKKEKRYLSHVLFTLDQMSKGGIYDQLEGGFARYSTDEKWFAPHFEKMLYDNAQIISLYSHVYRITKDENYRQLIDESLQFISENMMAPEGCFFSALDADSEGKEGTYYTWSNHEIVNIAGKDADIISNIYGITEKGNWENGLNILSVCHTYEELSKQLGLPVNLIRERLLNNKLKLLSYRSKRIKPDLDNKVIASWNGLMIIACIDAYKATANDAYLVQAIQCGDFILSQLIFKTRLTRIWLDIHQTEGFLDDYACVINAFIYLYEQTFNEKWLVTAREMTEYVIAHFYDETSKLFFYQSDKSQMLLTRKIITDDNVIPSPNSVMAENLFLLSKYTDNKGFMLRSKHMIASVSKQAVNNASYYTNWARISQKITNQIFEVVIIGETARTKIKELNSYFLPDIVVSGSISHSTLPLLNDRYVEGKTLIYICSNNTCKMPVEEISEALKMLNL
jgi:uncharacterized protein YyaL (SSP411 family)